MFFIFQLLGTAELSTDHVASLHDKIDRKTDVEQHNENVTSQYELQLHTNLDGMKESIKMFAEKQTVMSEQIRGNIGRIILLGTSLKTIKKNWY